MKIEVQDVHLVYADEMEQKVDRACEIAQLDFVVLGHYAHAARVSAGYPAKKHLMM